MLAPGKDPYDNLASQTASPQANDHAHNPSDSAPGKITRNPEDQHVPVSSASNPSHPSHIVQICISTNSSIGKPYS